mgnify:CR=1 FL=1
MRAHAGRARRPHRPWAIGGEGGFTLVEVMVATTIAGLAVIGTCKAEEIRRNADARPGDAIILTKPLGVGIYSAAIKKAVLPPDGYTDMIATTTLLNRVDAKLAKDKAVHAMTDVTGFGLLGHGLEMARGRTRRWSST